MQDDEDDDDDDDSLDQAQLDLLGVVANLVEHDIIDPEMKIVLVRLISNKDRHIIGIYNKFIETKNTNELVDNIIQIAKSNLYQSSRDSIESNSASSAPAEIEMVDYKRLSSNSNPPPEPASTKLLDIEDQKSIIEILGKSRVLNDSKTKYLNSLIEKKDQTIVKIFSVYEENKDVTKLIEAFQTIVLEEPKSQPKGEYDYDYESDNDDEVDEGDENEDDYDDDYEEEEEDEEEIEDRENVESRFMSIVQTMKLSELDTAALRLAISRNDSGIREALENFRIQKNDSLLMQQLRMVAKSTIDSTLDDAGYELESSDNEASNDQDYDDDQDAEDAEYLRKLEEEAGISYPMRNNSQGKANYGEDETGNNYGEEQEEEDDDDDDDEDDDGDDFMSSQDARQQIFPILVSELNKESIISETDHSTLLRLFSANNDVLHAALDVYDLENDMAELVDTLRNIVSNNTSASTVRTTSPPKATYSP